MPSKHVLGRRRRRQLSSMSRSRNRSANSSRRMTIEALEDRRLLAFGIPELNFDGQNFNGIQVPDTNGDVGGDYFVQMVNAPVSPNTGGGSTYTIYDKETGELVVGPTGLSLLAPLGSTCRVAPAGDPIVLYDELADQWLLSEFTAPATDAQGNQVGSLCVYISKNSDPTSLLPDDWYAYQFDMPVFPDYPKFAVWEDAYYVTANELSGLGPNTAGVYALDRQAMINGDVPAPYQRFTAPPLAGWGFQTLTPADLDGPAAPAGSPAYFARQRDDEIHNDPFNNPFVDFIDIFELKVDFSDPALSTFGLATSVPVGEFDSTVCGTAFGPCFPQPGTAVTLDPLKEFIMWRLQYRNFGEYETLVGNFVTDVFDADIGKVHWFELRKTEATEWGVHQEGTYFGPDFDNRWAAAIAMDVSGNIAMGYNVVSAGTLPDLRYTGRLADDPLGQMGPQEYQIANSSASSTTNRWGDYSSMSVDPEDGCTFWFTGQYMQGTGFWGTRIASMKFDACGTEPPIDPPDPGPGTISGIKWNDLDADGELDDDEPGMQGFYIYLDLDGDNSIDLGDPAAVTDEDGFYSITAPAGAYTVREVLSPGWAQTFPVSGEWDVIIVADEELPDINFGNTEADDFGDAPAPYPTLLADDGASHGFLPGFHLGALIDGELDGIPDADATGDDLTNLDDEDGVVFPWALFAGFTSSVDVTVSTGGFSPGVLNAWIDFNADGDWDDAGEQIADDRVLDDGTHAISFNVPATAVVGNTFSRFRYGYERNAGPTGPDMAGEVEDHLILVLEDQPNAVDDSFDIPQDSMDVPLDVLRNDFPSSTGSLTIVDVTQPTRATVEISPDGQELLITPDRGAFSPPNVVFTYTIDDGTGKQSTANVTVFILPDIVQPVAVDDTFRVGNTSSDNSLDVMANDIPGVAGFTNLVSFGDAEHGTVERDDNGTPGDLSDDKILYTPDNPGFTGFDQFVYTIGNPDGTSTAAVTIFGVPAPADQEVVIDLYVADSTGRRLDDGESLSVGDEFLLIAETQDLRAFQVAPGVYAAYLDILYNRDVALPNLADRADNSLGFEIEFSFFDPEDELQGGYFNGKSGSVVLPGLVDEVGAFWDGIPDEPDLPLEVFRITFTATGVGTATFDGNPADELPGHAVLLFNPAGEVPPSEIFYGFDEVEILVDGSSSVNSQPMDVNSDGHITPIDALLIINSLNHYGSRPIGEGESGGDLPDQKLDVNRDSYISAIDALVVINYLNEMADGGGGEGESAIDRAASPLDASPALNVDIEDSTLVAGASLLSLGPLSVLDVVQPSEPVIRSQSEAAAEWGLLVGEESRSNSSMPAAEDLDERSWENLLDDLAEDVLDAWLDPEDR